MAKDERITYPIELIHGAAEQIKRDTDSAIEAHQAHHRRAQDALSRLPGHLQHALGGLLASTHEYCLNIYQNKHHSLARTLHETATTMSAVDTAGGKLLGEPPVHD